MKYQDVNHLNAAIQLIIQQGALDFNTFDPLSSPEIIGDRFEQFKQLILDNDALLIPDNVGLIQMIPAPWRLFLAKQFFRHNGPWDLPKIGYLKIMLEMIPENDRDELIQNIKKNTPLMASELQAAKSHQNILIQSIFEDDQTFPLFRGASPIDPDFDQLQLRLTEMMSCTSSTHEDFRQQCDAQLSDTIRVITAKQMQSPEYPAAFTHLSDCELILRMARYQNDLSRDNRYRTATPWKVDSSLQWLAERAAHLLVIEMSYLPEAERLSFALTHLTPLYWVKPEYTIHAIELLPEADREKLFYNYAEMNEELSTIEDINQVQRYFPIIFMLPTQELRNLAVLFIKEKMSGIDWEPIEAGKFVFNTDPKTPQSIHATFKEAVLFLYFIPDPEIRTHVADSILDNKTLGITELTHLNESVMNFFNAISGFEYSNLAQLAALKGRVRARLPQLFEKIAQQLKTRQNLLESGYPQAFSFFKKAYDEQSNFLSTINMQGQILRTLREQGCADQLLWDPVGPLVWMVDEWRQNLSQHARILGAGKLTMPIAHIQNLNPFNLYLFILSLETKQKIAVLGQLYTNLPDWPVPAVAMLEFLNPLLTFPVSKENPQGALLNQFMIPFMKKTEVNRITWGKVDASGMLEQRVESAVQLIWALYLIPGTERLQMARCLLDNKVLNKEGKPSAPLSCSPEALPFIMNALKASVTAAELSAYSKDFAKELENRYKAPSALSPK